MSKPTKDELASRLEDLLAADQKVRDWWTPPYRCKPTCKLCKDYERMREEQLLVMMLTQDCLRRLGRPPARPSTGCTPARGFSP